MAKKVVLQTSIGPSLKVSPQVFQQTQIASMSRAELEHYLLEFSQTNPFFRIRFSKSGSTLFPRLELEYQDTMAAPGNISLLTDIREELLTMPISATQKWIGEVLVSSLLPNGSMSVSFESIASYVKVSSTEVRDVFEKIQAIFPHIRELSANPVEHFLSNLFPNPKDHALALEYWNNLQQWASERKNGNHLSQEEVRVQAKRELGLNQNSPQYRVLEIMDRALEDLILGSDLFDSSAEHQPVIIKPDILIREEGTTLVVEQPGEILFEVSNKPPEFGSRGLWRQAKNLVFSVQKQQHFFLDLVHFLIKVSEAFFRQSGYDTPLYQKDIAKHFSVHPSTVSRTLREKTFLYRGKIWPFKVLISKPLRILKSNTISSDTLMREIQDILEYTKGHRISDEKIRELLSHRKIHIARKTVNKYRRLVQQTKSEFSD